MQKDSSIDMNQCPPPAQQPPPRIRFSDLKDFRKVDLFLQRGGDVNTTFPDTPVWRPVNKLASCCRMLGQRCLGPPVNCWTYYMPKWRCCGGFLIECCCCPCFPLEHEDPLDEDFFGRNPSILHGVCLYAKDNPVGIVALLNAGADFTAKTTTGRTPYDFAIANDLHVFWDKNLLNRLKPPTGAPSADGMFQIEVV